MSEPQDNTHCLRRESVRSSYDDKNVDSIYAITKADGVAGLENADLKFSWMSTLFEVCHRTSFALLIVRFLMAYILLTVIFSVMLMIGGNYKCPCQHAMCKSADGEEEAAYENPFSHFSDAWVLSWTTFSTVGYGNVASPLNDGGKHCIIVHIVTALEAFIGILYAGFCGAILFTKVISSQSEAQVHFEECMCLRYKYESAIYDDDEGRVIHDDPVEDGGKMECPRLCFRVINCGGNVGRGDIVDATMSGFVIFQRQVNKTKNLKRASIQLGMMQTERDKNEENTTTYNRKFHAIDIQPSTHPYFEMDWVAYHTLDQNSPLLKTHMRKIIEENGGYWPCKLNNVVGIRRSLDKFEQLMLSISGTSQATGASVTARKIYDFDNIIVGYRFAEVVEYSKEKGFSINSKYINNLKEDYVGSGECMETFIKKLGKNKQKLSLRASIAPKSLNPLF